MNWSEMAKSQIPARHRKREELKKKFIAAVENGAALTKSGVVSRNTYLKWRDQDPVFAEWLKGVERKKPAPPRKIIIKRLPTSRGIFSDPLYVRASKFINRGVQADIRESAISELMLMILEGEEPDAREAMRRARGEFSLLPTDTADFHSETVWELMVA